MAADQGAATVREAAMPCAVLVDGPFSGLLVPVNGPFEIHLEGGVEYRVIERGLDTWTFPLRYEVAS